MTHTFTAMNAAIMSNGLSCEQERKLQAMFKGFEERASRFIPGNPVDELNQLPADVPVFLDATIADLLEKSLILTRKVGYMVNPFMGRSMKAIGYTASFHESYAPEVSGEPARGFTYEPMEWLSKKWILKLEDFHFDFGGFGKGYIADRAREMLTRENVTEALVNAGGDLVAIGRHRVGIAHPKLPGKDMIKLVIEDLAIATSGNHHRRWSHEGEDYHHILNGRTGEVATSDVVQSTVIASSAMEAEVVAKLFCILPYEEAKREAVKFPDAAYFVYLNDDRVAAGGNKGLYSAMEVAG